MAIGVLSEAGARMVAERARSRAAGEQRQAPQEQAVNDVRVRARRLAAAQQRRRVRQWRTLAGDPGRLAEVLRGLPVQEVARHWRDALGHTGDRAADAVLAAAQVELSRRLPTLMRVYDRRRRTGAEPLEAMQAAVAEVFAPVRPHGAAAYTAGGLPVLSHELEQQLRSSAGSLDEAQRNRWLQGLRERGWSAESLAWAEAILARSQEQRQAAAAAAATVDDPDTFADERGLGLEAASVATGRADDHARHAAALAAGGPGGHPQGNPARAAGPQQLVGPVRWARASFATPAAAVLLPAVPASAAAPAPAPLPTSRRGRGR